MLPPETETEKPSERSYTGIINRIVDTTKTIITVADHLRRVDKEAERTQTQVRSLSTMVHDLAKAVAEMHGEMKSIEKRLADRERLMELAVTVRVREEVESAIARLAPVPRPTKAKPKRQANPARNSK